MNVPTYMADARGVITWFNDAAVAAFGDLVGRSGRGHRPAASLTAERRVQLNAECAARGSLKRVIPVALGLAFARSG